MKKWLPIGISILLICSFANAQDVSGFWKGSLSMRGCFPQNNIELQINTKNGQLGGDSYHYQDVNNYVKKKFQGSFDVDQKRLFVKEGIVTTYHIPQRCVICVKDFELVYSKKGNEETLSGHWTGIQLGNRGLDCEGGSIVLTRIRESAFKEVPEIKVDTGSIRLDFYDNAEIDGDSISVLVNNRMVIHHQRLGVKPLTVFVKIDPQHTFQEVEMIAENLGSIPPNTAMLIITTGKKNYRLFLTSSEVKNAMVRFVYDPEETLKETASK